MHTRIRNLRIGEGIMKFLSQASERFDLRAEKKEKLVLHWSPFEVRLMRIKFDVC